MKDKTNKAPTLKELYPDFSDEKLAEVEARIDRHIGIVMGMYERISADPVEYARFRAALTKKRGGV